MARFHRLCICVELSERREVRPIQCARSILPVCHPPHKACQDPGSLPISLCDEDQGSDRAATRRMISLYAVARRRTIKGVIYPARVPSLIKKFGRIGGQGTLAFHKLVVL